MGPDTPEHPRQAGVPCSPEVVEGDASSGLLKARLTEEGAVGDFPSVSGIAPDGGDGTDPEAPRPRIDAARNFWRVTVSTTVAVAVGLAAKLRGVHISRSLLLVVSGVVAAIVTVEPVLQCVNARRNRKVWSEDARRRYRRFQRQNIVVTLLAGIALVLVVVPAIPDGTHPIPLVAAVAVTLATVGWSTWRPQRSGLRSSIGLPRLLTERHPIRRWLQGVDDNWGTKFTWLFTPDGSNEESRAGQIIVAAIVASAVVLGSQGDIDLERQSVVVAAKRLLRIDREREHRQPPKAMRNATSSTTTPTATTTPSVLGRETEQPANESAPPCGPQADLEGLFATETPSSAKALAKEIRRYGGDYLKCPGPLRRQGLLWVGEVDSADGPALVVADDHGTGAVVDAYLAPIIAGSLGELARVTPRERWGIGTMYLAYEASGACSLFQRRDSNDSGVLMPPAVTYAAIALAAAVDAYPALEGVTADSGGGHLWTFALLHPAPPRSGDRDGLLWGSRIVIRLSNGKATSLDGLLVADDRTPCPAQVESLLALAKALERARQDADTAS